MIPGEVKAGWTELGARSGEGKVESGRSPVEGAGTAATDGNHVSSLPEVKSAPTGSMSETAGSMVNVDVREAAIAFREEQYFRIDGKMAVEWAPLSGDYRTADGWVRLHCNFDHHRDIVLRALNLPSGADKPEVARACAGRTALDVEQAVTDLGGCAADSSFPRLPAGFGARAATRTRGADSVLRGR